MQTLEIIGALGKPFGAAEVHAVVGSLGIDKVPRAEMAPESWLTVKTKGVTLMFVDEDYLHRRAVSCYGNAPMILVSATLYSGPQFHDSSYQQYVGALPAGATFADSIERLRERLGVPTRVCSDEDIVVSRSWKRGSHWLVFNYDLTGTIKSVYLDWDTYVMRLVDAADAISP